MMKEGRQVVIVLFNADNGYIYNTFFSLQQTLAMKEHQHQS
jgi:hypothetical protein